MASTEPLKWRYYNKNVQQKLKSRVFIDIYTYFSSKQLKLLPIKLIDLDSLKAMALHQNTQRMGRRLAN